MLENDFFSMLCCPICKGELEQQPDLPEMSCPRCNHHYPIVDGIPVLLPCNVKERMPELFGRYWDSENRAQMYDTEVVGTNTFGRYNHESEIRGLLSCLDLGGASLLLDAGCGNGRFLATLPIHITSVGVDASLNLLRIAKTKGHGHYHVCCELEHLPFRDEVFDRVISCRVLQHLRAQNDAVGELCRVLEPGGEIAIEVYNKWNLKTIYKNIRMSKTARILNKPFTFAFRSLSPFQDWGIPYDRYNSWPELLRWLRAAGVDRIRGRGVGFGYHKYFFEPFLINAALEKKAPRFLNTYYRACSHVEKAIGSWVPFVYLMEKFVIAATKPATAPSSVPRPEAVRTQT
jgi:ubiquinone/menaquinone biosynthesis C-methylase UbiE/uncharacterized protein YbaR (Trm112 family)